MITSLTHSRIAFDETILHSLDQHLQSLTPNQKAGLAIASLYTAIKPKNTSVSINCDCSKLVSAVELVLQLSVPGKLAVVRVIAEELAVLEHLLEKKMNRKFAVIDVTDFLTLVVVWELQEGCRWELLSIVRLRSAIALVGESP